MKALKVKRTDKKGKTISEYDALIEKISSAHHDISVCILGSFVLSKDVIGLMRCQIQEIILLFKLHSVRPRIKLETYSALLHLCQSGMKVLSSKMTHLVLLTQTLYIILKLQYVTLNAKVRLKGSTKL